MEPDDPPARRRPGPVYDDAMKILADDDLGAVLSLVGIHDRAERLNVELAATTMKADHRPHRSRSPQPPARRRGHARVDRALSKYHHGSSQGGSHARPGP
jgi:hypothetical protein